MKDNGTEKSCVFNPATGEKEISIGLEKNEVRFTKDAVRMLKKSEPNSLILTHCHPDDMAFSEADLYKLGHYQSAKETIIECPQGNKYIFQRMAPASRKSLFSMFGKSQPTLMESYHAILNQKLYSHPVTKAYLNQETGLTMEAEQLYSRFVKETCKEVAEKLNFKFTEIR